MRAINADGFGLTSPPVRDYFLASLRIRAFIFKVLPCCCDI